MARWIPNAPFLIHAGRLSPALQTEKSLPETGGIPYFDIIRSNESSDIQWCNEHRPGMSRIACGGTPLRRQDR